MRVLLALLVICFATAACNPSSESDAKKDSNSGSKQFYDRLPKGDNPPKPAPAPASPPPG